LNDVDDLSHVGHYVGGEPCGAVRPTSVVTTDAAGIWRPQASRRPISQRCRQRLHVADPDAAAFEEPRSRSRWGAALPGDKRFAISTNWGTSAARMRSILAQGARERAYRSQRRLAMGFAQVALAGVPVLTFAW